MAEPAKLDDEQTSHAVDDIVAHEGDELLAVEDERLAEATAVSESQAPGRIKRFFKAWLGTSKGRWLTFLLLVGICVTIGAVPKSRYALLNAAGVRASLSVEIIDKSTLQPLSGIKVGIQGRSTKTDNKGRARLNQLRLGPAELTITKPGFAPITRNITVGWGSNPLGDIQLEPVGSQYVFRLTDYLSGQGISGAVVVSGEATASADSKGQAVLTLDEPDEEIKIEITAEGYRKESFTISAADTKERVVRLVLARSHVFISKRTGTFDLYKIDIDGQNEELVLKGVGAERSDTIVLPHPSANVVALVSRRSPQRGSDGLALNVLTVIDVKTKATEIVTTSESIRPIGWSGNRLSYITTLGDANIDAAERQRLMSYDWTSKNNKELAAANSFNAALLAAGQLYYAPAAAHQNGINVSLFRAAPDGSSSAVVLSGEVLNIVRTAYDNLALLASNGWYNYKLGDKPAAGNVPPSLVSRAYLDNADGSNSIWSENRSGQGALLVYDVKQAQEKTLQSQVGLQYPLSWLSNDAVVYRVRTAQETADYAISLQGGKPQKITDVTHIGSE